MAKSAQDLLNELGAEGSTILSAKRAVNSIIGRLGGMEAWAEMIADLLRDLETPSGTKANIHRALLGAILNINEAEGVHGEVLDEQTNAMIEALQNQAMQSGDDDGT